MLNVDHLLAAGVVQISITTQSVWSHFGHSNAQEIYARLHGPAEANWMDLNGNLMLLQTGDHRAADRVK